jgi:hypothetical protein
MTRRRESRRPALHETNAMDTAVAPAKRSSAAALEARLGRAPIRRTATAAEPPAPCTSPIPKAVAGERPRVSRCV